MITEAEMVEIESVMDDHRIVLMSDARKLIGQVRRLEKALHDCKNQIHKEVVKLEAENKRLREALELIAKPHRWDLHTIQNGGGIRIAKDALKGDGDENPKVG